MYASDVINRNRAATLYINSVLKNKEFTSGKSIRIDGQKGGNDYQYLINVDCGNIVNYDTYIPLPISIGINQNIFAIYNLTQINLGARDSSGNLLYADVGAPQNDASGNPYKYNGGRMIDDGSIRIPSGGKDFYFFGTNYGAANNIFWQTNNSITFGRISNDNIVSISKNTVPAILLGNYDRMTSAIYSSNYYSSDQFGVIVIVVYFADYYTNTTNFDAGKYQIRLIREINGSNRQWVEVSIISSPSSPGYSNNNSITYPSGRDASGNNIDANGLPIDSTKNSPYDITNGSSFLNICGTTYSTVSPQAGTNFLYQSDGLGNNWNFIPNGYIAV